MAKKKQIRNVLCFLVMIVIFMSVMPVSVFAVNDSDNTTGVSNPLNELESAFTEKSPSSGDCAPVPDADLPEIYLNGTQECVLSSDSGNDTNIIILTDVSNETNRTVSALSCSVKSIIDDPCCKGYKVYVDGVYQFTEGQGKTPDGYCSFYVSAGTHTIRITKNGRSASKANYFQCGTTYRWISMPHCWCEDGDDDDCKYPPTVKFDKTKYYEGDTVHVTVSTSQSSVYYKIKDCGGTIRKSGTTSNGKKISYTIPKGASKCCYWQICFYWDEYTPPWMALAGAGGEVTAQSYDCTKCYKFYVCPKTTCDVYVKIDDPCCVGYKVYVDGKYQFTEGGDGTPPDGYCAFHVKEGTHTLKITKNGRSASKTINFECNIVYRWVSMPKNWCGDGEAYVEIKDKYCKGYEVYVDDVYQFTEGRSGTPDGNCGFFVGEGTHTIEIRKNGRSASLIKYFECSYRYTWVSMPDYWCDPCYDPPIVTFDTPPDYQGDKPKYSGGDKLSATVSTSQSSVYYEIKDCGGTVLTNGYTSNAGKISYTIPTSVSTCCYWTICFYWSGDGGGGLAGGQDPAQYYDCIECYTFYVCPDPCYDPPIVTFINPPDYEGDKPKYSVGNTVHATVSSSHGSVYYAIKDCNGKVQTTGSAGDGDSISYLIPRVELTDCCYWTICFYWGGNGDWLATGVDPAQYYDCTKCYTFEVCPICTANVKIDDDTCVGYNVYVDDVYQLTEGVGETPDGYCSFDVTEGVHSIEIRDNECFASIRRYFECGSTYLWVTMSDNWCKCKNCPSEVRFEGTAKTDELAGLVCYKTYYCDVIADRILYDPDNTLQVGNVYTVGYGDEPKNITAGDKVVVNGTYYHNCGPFGAYGRICGDLWKDLPDLIIEDIKLPSKTVCLGDLIPITVTVKNIGGDKANQSVVKYYVGNKYIDLDTVPSLVPNATSNQTFNWTANSCGNISVMAIADANHTVRECNESNNDKQKRIEASGPDLITHIWPIGATGTVCLGEAITFTVTVINTGDCTAGQSVVKYYAGGEYIDSKLIPSLSPGASSTQTFTWTASSCGNVSVRAVADANHNVRECNESNNDKAKSIEVDGPDLIISDITLPSGKICLGQPVTITVTVKNQGGCPAGASTVKYFVDNKYVDSDTILSLDPGASSTQTFTWTADSCGNVSVKAVADANNEVHECDENNNDNQKSIEVDGPDLIIQDITLPSGKICLGQPVTITVTVKNEDGCTAGASIVKYFVDNKYVDSDSIPSLDPSAASTQTFTWTADSCGNVSVKAVADANNEVHECDENNNENQKSIEVDGPDLIIAEITIPDETICLDHEITISVLVKNQGGCAAGPSTVEYYDGSTLISSDTVSNLAPDGGEEKKTFAWTPTTCGTHTIKAVADAKDEVHECVEDNNEKTVSVEVDGPDLIIAEITIPDETICLDHEITISVLVKNQGGCAAGPSTVEYYDGGTLITSDTVSSLAQDGGEEKKTFAWTPTTCGSHTIKAVADAKNEVHECVEDNNEKTVSVEVDGPDLIIAEITIPDETICLDHEITISVLVKNQGGCAAGPSTVEYYDGGTLITSDTVSSLAQDGGEEKKTFAWTPTTCGSHTIKAVADAKDEVHECIEDNNEKTVSVEVDGPDLIIADITVPDETICLDHEITISVTVKNQGGCAAGPSTIEYYDGSTLISSDTVSSLAPDGGEEKKTFAWTPTTCGSHTIKAVADAKNEVHECVEDNNEKTESVEVDGPDLIIAEIAVPDGTICLDHEITISVTVKNQGGCAAGPSTIEYYDGSTLITSDTVSSLAQDGGEEKKTFAWTPTTCGTHTIKAVADAKDEVHECIEDNNEKTVSVEVDGPDLIIEEITVPDETICLDHEITISVLVKNQGGCAAGPSTIEYYDGGTLISSDTVSSLAQDGGEEKKTFTWTPTTCGTHTIKAVADAKDEVHECIEDNNDKTVSVEVDGPDLIIADITVPDETICLDHEITISVTVKNQGGCAAGHSTIEYYDGSTLISSDTVSNLAPDGGEEKKTFAWTPTTCGTHTIKAVADAKNEVHECVEDNNDKTESVEVDGPDLIIAEITVPDETICLDHEITISVLVKNQGGCAAGPSTVEYYDGGTLISSDTVSSLAQDGGEEKKTFTWTPTTCGSHTIKAVADAKDEVHECVEDNNEKTVSVEVDGPDLIIQDISLPSGTICLNSPVNIEVTTANIGECPTTKQFTVMLYVASKEMTDTIEYLEDGNSIKSTFEWIPDACGNHNLKAVADINNDIHECNEDNNENKKSIKVEGPDLIVKEISPASDLFIGVTTDINIAVENQGECRAIPFVINYSIDGTEESTIHVTSFLSPHTTETVHFSWTPNSCGSHQITAVADSFKFVPECNEDNNQKTQSVDVKGPDLIIEPITVSQPTTIGTQIKFTVVIRNKGTADAGNSYMRCYVDVLPIGAKISVPAISTGQTSTHDVSWTASGCGPHTFKAVADVDLNVIECDEENNDKQASFTVKCPDLIIESITPSPGSPAPNQQVTFSVVVKNKGDADAGDSTLKCFVGSTAICTESAGKIPAGKTSTRSCTWTGSGCAEHNFKAVADAVGNKVTESDETNNEKIRVFSVVDSVKPTITIGSPSKGYTSSSSSITVKGSASDNSGVAKVEVKVNDGEWQEASGTTSWSKTVSLSEGANTITVKATDICGNEQSTSITVHYKPSTPSNPDFTISIAPSSRTICAGESATYTVSLTAEDGFSSSVALEVSGLPTGATASFDPGQITPSGTATLTIDTETATTEDTYTITVTGTGGGKTHEATATLIISSQELLISNYPSLFHANSYLVVGENAASIDVIGGIRLINELAYTGSSIVPMLDSEASGDTAHNILAVGGPMANSVTSDLNNDMGLTISSGATKSTISISGWNTFEVPKSWEGSEDLAVVAVRKVNGRNVMVVWGITGQGTWAACKYISNPDNRANLNSNTTIIHWKDLNEDKQVSFNDLIELHDSDTRLNSLYLYSATQIDQSNNLLTSCGDVEANIDTLIIVGKDQEVHDLTGAFEIARKLSSGCGLERKRAEVTTDSIALGDDCWFNWGIKNIISVGGPNANSFTKKQDEKRQVDYSVSETIYQIIVNEKSYSLDFSGSPKKDIGIVYRRSENNKEILVLWGIEWYGTHAICNYFANDLNFKLANVGPSDTGYQVVKWTDINRNNKIDSSSIDDYEPFEIDYNLNDAKAHIAFYYSKFFDPFYHRTYGEAKLQQFYQSWPDPSDKTAQKFAYDVLAEWAGAGYYDSAKSAMTMIWSLGSIIKAELIAEAIESSFKDEPFFGKLKDIKNDFKSIGESYQNGEKPEKEELIKIRDKLNKIIENLESIKYYDCWEDKASYIYWTNYEGLPKKAYLNEGEWSVIYRTKTAQGNTKIGYLIDLRSLEGTEFDIYVDAESHTERVPWSLPPGQYKYVFHEIMKENPDPDLVLKEIEQHSRENRGTSEVSKAEGNRNSVSIENKGGSYDDYVFRIYAKKGSGEYNLDVKAFFNCKPMLSNEVKINAEGALAFIQKEIDEP